MEKAIKACGLGSIDKEDIVKIVKRIVFEGKEFVKERGTNALGPLMGSVMKEFWGKVEGKEICKVLNEEI